MFFFAHLPMALADDLAVSVGQVLVAAASICSRKIRIRWSRTARNRSDHVSRLASIVRGYCVRRHGQDAGGEWYQRAIFDYFLEAARHSARLRQSGRRPSFANRLRHRMGDILIYAPPKGSDRSVKIARRLCHRLGDYPGTAVVLQGNRRELEDKVWPDRSRKLFDGSGRS